MTEFIILSRVDMQTLCSDKPVTVYIDKKPYLLCTDEYFEKQAVFSVARGNLKTNEFVQKCVDLLNELDAESEGKE